MPSQNSVFNNPPKNTSISYNGYTFPEYRQVKHKCEPIYDSTGRARTGVKYSFEIHFIIPSPDQATGAKTIPQIRCALTSPGGVLAIQGLGFGDMTINGSNATRQVMDFGPHPQLVHFDPVGGVLAYEVIWACDVTLVECCSSSQSGGPAGSSGGGAGQPTGDAWANSIVYSIDDRGYTTRTTTGYLEIPLARVTGAATTVATTADAYRNLINVILPFGFRRAHQDYRLSADRRQLEFVIVDSEMEGDDFLPPGIARGSFERSLSNNGDMNFQNWTYSINATFERTAGTSRDWAFQQWFLLVSTTIATIQQNMMGSDPGATSGGSNTGTVLPSRISMSTDCFKRTVRLSTSFKIIRSSADVIKATGIWEPLNTDYQSWANTMGQWLWTARGNAQLYHDSTSDSIIDPCNTTNTLTVKDLTRIYQLGVNATRPTLGCGGISPSTSWLTYNCWTEADKKNYNVIQNPSQKYTQDSDSGPDFFTDETSAGKYGPAKYQPIVQTRGAPVTTVRLIGYATRVKFRPTVPALLTYGGQQCVEFRRVVGGPAVVGSLAGCDVYAVKWDIEYRLTGVPTSDAAVLDQPRPQSNPLPGGGGTGGTSATPGFGGGGPS
ncbi:MAG TPA: hypothetical protein VHY91_16700 [Pirellulales bacterium]|jgi:hypothetical protein|nr:hypothetical protein [Pirellulales bacterium]